MAHLILGLASLLTSGLTFFTGFGLGTLLLPVFSLFFAVSTAVALTAVVHLLNNLFKFVLVGRHANWRTVVRFGVPALIAALLGASLLQWLDQLPPLVTYAWGTHTYLVTPINAVVALMMLAAAMLELWPPFKTWSVPPQYLPLGGLLSGFIGGLSGHQGAFRSAFLIRLGMGKETFIATGVVIAVLVDLSRLSVYLTGNLLHVAGQHGPLLVTATLAAFTGALAGQRLLRKISIKAIEKAVGLLMAVTAVALGLGWI